MSEQPQSAILVELADKAFDFYTASDGTPFAVDPHGPNVAMPLRGSRGLRSALAHLHQTNYGKPPNAAALTDALLVLEGMAGMNPTAPLPLRFARHDGGLILDLGTSTGEAVRITSTGWSMVTRSPLTFRRTALTGALPVPREGGDLHQLRDLLNVSERSWQLVVGFVVAAMLPDIPHAILAWLGEQGTGKSTAARLLVQTVDPGPAPLRSAPRDVEGWVVSASGSHFVAIDNASAIAPWFSDALCRAATGDGLVRRMLYSDSDLSVLAFLRVVMLTSIDAGDLRGDLADRLLTVPLDTITPDRRRTDADLEAAFREAHPFILGALLDLVVEVLAELPRVRLTEYPRMADFARVLAAIDTVRGTKSLSTYLKLGDSLAEDVVDSDPVATKIRDLAVSKGTWTGTASELLDLITPDPIPKRWPANAKSLSGALTRCAPALRTLGIEVENTRESGGDRRRLITITAYEKSPNTDKSPNTTPNKSPNGASVASLPPQPDARDARDAQVPEPLGDMFDDDRYEAEVSAL